MATKKAAAKTPGTSMVKWEEQMAQDAVVATTSLGKTIGQRIISVRSGIMSVGVGKEKVNVQGSKLAVVALDQILVRTFYGQGIVFDADNPATPICWAMNRVEADLAPKAEQVTAIQADTCADCKWSKFNTADTGKGQACKDTRRIGVITEDSLDDIINADVAFLQTPPTSNTAWDGYVKNVKGVFNRPPYGIVTSISCQPDQKVQVVVKFASESKVEDSKHFKDANGFESIMAKRELVREEIFYPYQKLTAEQLAEQKSSGGKKSGASAKTSSRSFTKAKPAAKKTAALRK